jgi:hypothetical protein
MASFAGPSIVTLNQGLILHLSAPDTKSYNYQENLLTYSEQFDLWNNTSNIIFANTATTLAPNVTQTAERVIVDPAGLTYQSVDVIGSSTYTFSFYVKSVSGSTGTHGVNWYTNSTGHNRQTVPVTGTWTQVSILIKPPVTTSMNVYIADNRSALASLTDVYLWGAQLNAGPAPAAYVVTTSTNITPSTSWIDLSLNKNNATLTNIPRYSSSSTGYLAFSSATSTAATMPYSIAYEFAGLSPYTFELWTRPYEDPGISTYRRIIGHENNGPRDGYTMYVNNSVAGSYSLYHERWTNNNYITGVGFTVPSASIFGTWNHIVVTFDGSIYNMYRNNVLVSGPATISSTGTLTAYGIQLTLGSYYSVGNYSGDISDFKVYNRALTIAEIDRNFQAHRDRYGL